MKLAETGADGFVPASTLGNDFYRYEERLHALVGSRSGETYRLGDMVQVRLVEAAPFAGALRFEVLSEGRNRRDVPGADKLHPSNGRRDKTSPSRKGGRPPHTGSKKPRAKKTRS